MRVDQSDTSMTVSFSPDPGAQWIAGTLAFIAVVMLSVSVWATFFEASHGTEGIAPFWGFGVLFALLFARRLHGWRTTLIFDRPSGELRILRKPALLPSAQRTLPLASVARAESRGWLRHGYGSSHYALTRFRLVAKDRRRLFQRRLGLADEEGTRRRIDAINDFLGVDPGGIAAAST
jgi:hypothetical protein